MKQAIRSSINIIYLHLGKQSSHWTVHLEEENLEIENYNLNLHISYKSLMKALATVELNFPEYRA